MSVAQRPLVGTFTVDASHSSLQFAVKHMEVVTYRALFEDVEATVVGDDEGLRLEGSSPVESISIRVPPFRDQVLGERFFDAANHPTVAFRSDDVRIGEGNDLVVRGQLTIRGVTRPIDATGTFSAPVEDPYGQLRAAVELKTTIDRREWGMDWQGPLPKGGHVLGWDVEMTVFLALVQ